MEGFNPLHCGAVVASPRGGAPRRADRLVSIPFIAGQWSLQPGAAAPSNPDAPFQSPSLRGSGRFEWNRAMAIFVANYVSIPFIAGQWSLLPSWLPGIPSFLVFQSPSLRGSGRFRRVNWSGRLFPESFNPLHCGAVVASIRINLIPGERKHVSIPFIAGQWSLHTSSTRPPLDRSGFNPLHCGAVVASGGFHRRLHNGLAGFNPLHCGAVVASNFTPFPRKALRLVSIPFLAGQWSLPLRLPGVL